MNRAGRPSTTRAAPPVSAAERQPAPSSGVARPGSGSGDGALRTVNAMDSLKNDGSAVGPGWSVRAAGRAELAGPAPAGAAAADHRRIVTGPERGPQPSAGDRATGCDARPLNLLPHQVQAQTALLEELVSADRATALMACGTGKTLLGQRTAESLGAELTLVMLPSIGLVAQTCREWRRNALRPTAWVAVCSDRTAGVDDDISTAEVPVPVTTDPGVLRTAVLSAAGPVVVFATYQSADVVAACGLTWDLLLCDEAHRTTGAAGSAFGLVLDDDRIRARKRIFLTATPRYYRGGAAASMDDEKLYGPVAHRMPFSAAIEQGLLCDYKIVVVGVAEREVHNQVAGAGERTVRGGPLTLHETAAQAAVLRTMKRFGLQRVLTFHSRVKRAANFARTLPQAAAELGMDPVAAEHVSGKTPASVRAEVLARLAGGQTQIVSNARCLSEGVNVPTIDAIAMVDPRRSKVDVVQALGRAIRKADGKTCGYVILPVFISTEDDEVDRVAQAGSFDAVWEVLRALRAHDDVLATQLDEARRAKGRGEPVRLPAKLLLDLPAELPPDFYDAFTAQLVDDTTDAWEEMFARYQAAGPDLKDPTLQRWASNQRLRRRQGWMPREQIDRLSALPGWQWSKALDATARAAATGRIEQLRASGMTWRAIADRLNDEQLPTATGGRWSSSTAAAVRRETAVRTRQDRWQVKYDRLLAWTTANGPLQRRNPGLEPDISMWVSLQKQQYHRRSRSPLPSHRAALLERVPGWSW